MSSWIGLDVEFMMCIYIIVLFLCNVYFMYNFDSLGLIAIIVNYFIFGVVFYNYLRYKNSLGEKEQ